MKMVITMRLTEAWDARTTGTNVPQKVSTLKSLSLRILSFNDKESLIKDIEIKYRNYLEIDI